MLINHKINYISEIDKFFLASPENEIYFCASFLEATLSDFSDKYGDDFLSSPMFLIYPHLSFTLSDNDKIVSNGINTTIGVKSIEKVLSNSSKIKDFVDNMEKIFLDIASIAVFKKSIFNMVEADFDFNYDNYKKDKYNDKITALANTIKKSNVDFVSNKNNWSEVIIGARHSSDISNNLIDFNDFVSSLKSDDYKNPSYLFAKMFNGLQNLEDISLVYENFVLRHVTQKIMQNNDIYNHEEQNKNPFNKDKNQGLANWMKKVIDETNDKYDGAWTQNQRNVVIGVLSGMDKLDQPQSVINIALEIKSFNTLKYGSNKEKYLVLLEKITKSPIMSDDESNLLSDIIQNSIEFNKSIEDFDIAKVHDESDENVINILSGKKNQNILNILGDDVISASKSEMELLSHCPKVFLKALESDVYSKNTLKDIGLDHVLSLFKRKSIILKKYNIDFEKDLSPRLVNYFSSIGLYNENSIKEKLKERKKDNVVLFPSKKI